MPDETRSNQQKSSRTLLQRPLFSSLSSSFFGCFLSCPISLGYVDRCAAHASVEHNDDRWFLYLVFTVVPCFDEFDDRVAGFQLGCLVGVRDNGQLSAQLCYRVDGWMFVKRQFRLWWYGDFENRDLGLPFEMLGVQFSISAFRTFCQDFYFGCFLLFDHFRLGLIRCSISHGCWMGVRLENPNSAEHQQETNSAQRDFQWVTSGSDSGVWFCAHKDFMRAGLQFGMIERNTNWSKPNLR